MYGWTDGRTAIIIVLRFPLFSNIFTSKMWLIPNMVSIVVYSFFIRSYDHLKVQNWKLKCHHIWGNEATNSMMEKMYQPIKKLEKFSKKKRKCDFSGKKNETYLNSKNYFKKLRGPFKKELLQIYKFF